VKVLVVSNGYPPRGRFGTEFYTHALVVGLRARGHAVEVLHPVRGSGRPRYTLECALEDGVPLHLLHNDGDPRRSFASSYRDDEVERVFDELLAELAPDVVHFVHLLWGLSVRLPGLARARGVRTVATVTDYGLLCHRGQMFDHRLERCGGPHPADVCARCIRTPSPYDAAPAKLAVKRLAVRALAAVGGLGRVVCTPDVAAREGEVRDALAALDVVLAPSAAMEQAFASAGAPSDRLWPLVYAFDEAPYAAVRGTPAGDTVALGFLGQFAPHKGLGVLLDAVRRLESGPDLGRPWEVRLYGAAPGGRHAHYAQAVLDRFPGARVVRPGSFSPEEAPAVLAQLAAVVVPSLWDENAPLVTLQARAAGVPVVASDTTGIRGVIEDGRHGLLVPPGDAAALADALARVVRGELGPLAEPGLPLPFDRHLARVERAYGAGDAADAGDPPLAVGMIAQGWFPDAGGVESHTRDLARQLRERGHRVRALCLDYRPGRVPFSTEVTEVEGVEVTRVAYLYHDHDSLARLVHHPELEAVVERWLDAGACDAVHVHHLTGFGLGVLGRLADRGVPTVVTLHDYWALCPRGQMLRPDRAVCERPVPETCAACLGATWPHLLPSSGGGTTGPAGEELRADAEATAARTDYALRQLARATRLLAPSRAAREVYRRAGFDADRIEVCENGIEVARLAAEVARLRADRDGRDDGRVRLGVLGSVLPSKGVLELARAFQRADADGLTLEIHGSRPPYHGDGSYVEELERLAAEDPRVTLHGPYRHDELAAILAGLDGVAAPSRWAEVYGLTVREARAAGLPVLVSDAGDLAAVADGGATGEVVAANDAEAWIAALRRFATDADARAAWAMHPVTPRSSAEMALQVEGALRDAVRDVRG
jgi:glycosyltransferase involved in cell wall biosynthesis